MTTNIESTHIEVAEQGSAPATPASGSVRLYAKSDGNLYQKDDTGTETSLAGGGGSSREFSDTSDIGTLADGDLLFVGDASDSDTVKDTTVGTLKTYINSGGGSTTVDEYDGIAISTFNTTSTSYVNVTGTDQSHTFTSSTALIFATCVTQGNSGGTEAHVVVQVDGTDGSHHSGSVFTTGYGVVAVNYFTGISTGGAVTIRLRLKSSSGSSVSMLGAGLVKYTILEGV